MANYDIRPLQLRILKNLLAVDKVCKEHNLRYYIMAGTMLGAVRHKGFIPWDEDMDINMKRKDCERLIEIYKNTPEFSKKYYLCDNSYDKEFDVNFLRIKLKGTSFKEYLYEDYSKDGVFIDIFLSLIHI